MISIVMPTYNRCHNLKTSYELIDKTLTKANLIYELIVVDDGSVDKTKDTLRELCSFHSTLKGIVLKKNYGQQNATLAGIRMSKYPYIVTLDDDLSHDPSGIIAMYNMIQTGYDVVYGVSDEPHDKHFRNIGTQVKEAVFFLLLKKPHKLRLTSFRMMTREVAIYLGSDTSSKVYLSAKTLHYTRRIKNVPIKYLTKGEDSQYTVWKLVALMTQIVMNYTWISPIYQHFCHTKQYEIMESYQ